MRAWIACAILVAVCARVGWVTRSNRQAVQITALVALAGVAMTALR